MRLQEAAIRAIARDTRPRVVDLAALLTIFAVWRVIAVARYDYAIAAQIVSALDPLAAFLGLAVAYRGLFLGCLVAILVAWPTGRAFDDDVASPVWGFVVVGAVLTFLRILRPSDIWSQAVWVFTIVLC